jgi:hypothetical protein
MMALKVRNAEGQTAMYKRELEDLLKLHEESLVELEAVQALQNRAAQSNAALQEQVKRLQDSGAGVSQARSPIEPLSLSVQTRCVRVCVTIISPGVSHHYHCWQVLASGQISECPLAFTFL